MCPTGDKEFLSTKNMEEFLKKNAIMSTQNVLRDIKKSSNSKKDPGQGKKIETGFFSLSLSTVWKAGGTATKVYELVPKKESYFSSLQDGFRAYWLAYYEDRTYRSILGNDATKYMFTANLSGCTFAHGSQTSTGHIIVGHSNEATAGDAANKAAKGAGQSFEDAKREGRQTQAESQKSSIDAKFAKKDVPDNTKISYLHPSAYGEFSYPLPNINRSELSKEIANEPIKDIAQYGAFVVGVKEENVWKFYCQRRVLIDKIVVVQDVIEI